MLAKLERILKVNSLHLMDRSFMRFLIKWKDCHVDVEGLSWELENESKELT